MPHKGNWLYWLYFCILCNKNGIKGLWGHKDQSSLGLGPALVLQWTLPWPYNTPNTALIYWLYFCIICNKNGIKWLRGDQCWPPKGPGPALVPQWTLQGPYNTPNMVLYILAIFLHSMQQKWDQGTLETQRSTHIGSRNPLGPSMDPTTALQYTLSDPSGFWDVSLVRPGLDWTQTRL